jgi:hypothetical protein
MISEFYSDEDIVSQLRSFFDETEREEIDFWNALSTVSEDDEYFTVMVKSRKFRFHSVIGDVEEVE